MIPYADFIEQLVQIFEAARHYQLGGFEFPPRPEIPSDSPVVLIFSPHPDDECIIGGLPLRLLRELRLRVVNVPVTLGSNLERRRERYIELANACSFLGFGLLPIQESGLDNITPEGCKNDRSNWDYAVTCVVNILTSKQPQIVFFPHNLDGHPTHQGTSLLILEALAKMPPEFSCYTVETEYWRPMDYPNIMVEVKPQELIDLVTALTFHVQEVKRNPYHLSLPAWMMDTVRRGSEIMGPPGTSAQGFMFGTMYKLRRWHLGQLVDVIGLGRFVAATDDMSFMLPVA